MASRESKHQKQRNNQIREITSKLRDHFKEDHATDPSWSFLEDIDAPQWVDLSLEARSKGNDEFDSWFAQSHEYHVISLAGVNSGTSWVGLDKSCLDKQGNQSVISHGKNERCQGVVMKMEKVYSMREPKVSDYRRSNILKDSRPEKRPSYYNSSYRCRTFSTHHSLSVLRGMVDKDCTFSGSSNTSDYDQGRSPKECSSCSDISSVTSSLQDYSAEPSSSVNGWRGSLKEFEDSYGTPKCGVDSGQRRRSFSSASNYFSMPKAGHTSDAGNSTCNRLRRSELGVFTLVCPDDTQLSKECIPTFVSGASCLSQEHFMKGCVRIKEQASSDHRKVGELDDIMNCYPTCKEVDVRRLQRQYLGKETLKCSFELGRQSERGSLVGLLPRKQPCLEKENAPSIKNLMAASSLQVKHKFSPTRAPLALASMKTANAKYDTSRKSFDQGYHAPAASKKVVHGQAASFEDGVSHFIQQMKRAGAKQLPVTGCMHDKTIECKKNLAALVAQHNQKIWKHGAQGCRKGLR